MNWVRMYHTVRHVRPRQLYFRLFLTARRKWRVRNATSYKKALMEAPLPDLTLSDSLPAPLFPPREHFARTEGDLFTLTFLNESRQFTLPFNWHPKELEYGTRLWLLNLHYMEFLEAVSDEDFVRITSDWIEQVTPYRPTYWLDDWNSFSLSIRCVVWMQQFVRRQHSFSDTFKDQLLGSLTRQVRFLAENLELDIGGNHLLKNIKALLWAGVFWQHDEAREWKKLGHRLLDKELKEQLLDDGMHYELSPAYNGQVFADLLECYQVLEEGYLKQKLKKQLHLMAQAVIDTAHPDGMTSLLNDGGLRMAYLPEQCLHVWEQLTGEQVQAQEVFALEQAGYYGLRLNDNYIIADCAAIAPDFLTAHGHGDVFSFEWSIGDKRILVDAGVYEYNPGYRRDYSRSTKSHNTVTLDGLDQCEFWGAFRMAKRARIVSSSFKKTKNGFVLEGTHDGYKRLKGEPLHKRKITAQSGNIRVEDEIIGGDKQHAEARLLLHPLCKVELKSQGAVIRRDDIVITLHTDNKITIKDAVWYPDFGVEEKCKQLEISYGLAPCKAGFSLTEG